MGTIMSRFAWTPSFMLFMLKRTRPVNHVLVIPLEASRLIMIGGNYSHADLAEASERPEGLD